MTLVVAYIIAFGFLGAWGLFTARPLWRVARPWAWRHWHFLLAEVCLIGGSWLNAGALSAGRFAGWMLLPVGASYALMIPLPCYFAWVDRVRWVHRARNALFALIAATCLAVGLGVLPPSILGLARQ
jgi:hypothetical protein